MKLIKSIGIVFLFSNSMLMGCTHVEAWQRGNIAKPQMSLNLHPMQSALRAHNYGSREAAANNAGSTGGGGCGCY